MFEVFSEVRATLSVDFLDAIGGIARLEAIRAAFTAPTYVEQVAEGNVIQLCGTLDSILCAKSTLEDIHKEMLMKRLSDESKELDSTTFSEENSSQADEGNTSYDKEEGTDKASCLSDDKEQDEHPPPRCLRLVPKRVRVLDHRVRQQLLRRKKQPHDHPDALSENLRQMKLAGTTTTTAAEDSDSTEDQRLRRPCRARNFETCVPVKRKRRVLNCSHCSYKTSRLHYFERHQRLHSHSRGRSSHHSAQPSTSEERCPKCRMGLPAHSRQCDFCSIMSRSKAFLKRHAHYLQARYACEKCNKRFVSRCNLRNHQNLHTRSRRPKLSLPSPDLPFTPGPSHFPTQHFASPPLNEISYPPSFAAPFGTSDTSNNALQPPSQLQL